MKIMTLLTDFGLKSPYVSQMKGLALSLTDAKIIDITHEISSHNIREGAFILRSTINHFPSGTVHVAVVDPGVGTARRGIVITTPTQILIGPDNGLLIPAAELLGNYTVYEITNQQLMHTNISNTFHGRDIFVPVAAHILNGRYFSEIGPIINNYINLDFGNSEVEFKTAKGKVIYIDNFGNIITNIDGPSVQRVLPYDSKIMLYVGKKQNEIKFVRSYNYVNKGELLATVGSSNLLEISLNQGNAAEKLEVKADDEVKLLYN